jgi:uncharacterized protein
MRDGPLRRVAKAVALANHELSRRVTRALRRRRGEEAWTLGGACRRSGCCCEAPGIQTGRIVWHVPLARQVFLWWQRRINGFELRGTRPRERVFVFECTHFDPVSRDCDSYDSRPGMCRDYPRALLDQASPELFPECGYRVTPENAERLSALIDTRVAGARARELKRRLGIGS